LREAPSSNSNRRSNNVCQRKVRLGKKTILGSSKKEWPGGREKTTGEYL